MVSRKWLGLAAILALVPVCYGVTLTPVAEYQKGEIYWHNVRMPHRQRLAAYWWLKSSYRGYAPAEYALSQLYGPHTKGRYQGLLYLRQSYRWAQKAAAQGYVPAESFLSGFYDGSYNFFRGSSEQFPKNPPLAFYWEHKAAIQGYGPAELRLSDFYSAARNRGKDLYWEKKAMGQGMDAASLAAILGMRYAHALGVSPSHVRAYKWYWISLLLHGKSFSPRRIEQSLSKLRALMTPAQVARAQSMAVAWVRRHPQAKNSLEINIRKEDQAMAVAWEKAHTK